MLISNSCNWCFLPWHAVKKKNITVNYQRFWNNLYLICFSSLHAISNKVHVFNDIYTFQLRMCNPRACKWISRWQTVTDFSKVTCKQHTFHLSVFRATKECQSWMQGGTATSYNKGVGSGGGGLQGRGSPHLQFLFWPRKTQLRVRVNFRLCTMFK